MHIRSTVNPGQRGAKKLLSQYGDRLVYVRYRYVERRQRRGKTVEWIIAEEGWAPPQIQPKRDALVSIRLTLPKTTLHQQVKQYKGRWDAQRGIWELRYEQVMALGLEAHVIDSGSL